MNHTEASYRAYWAVLTGKNPSEIYVPEALRTPVPLVSELVDLIFGESK